MQLQQQQKKHQIKTAHIHISVVVVTIQLFIMLNLNWAVPGIVLLPNPKCVAAEKYEYEKHNTDNHIR